MENRNLIVSISTAKPERTRGWQRMAKPARRILRNPCAGLTRSASGRYASVAMIEREMLERPVQPAMAASSRQQTT